MMKVEVLPVEKKDGTEATIMEEVTTGGRDLDIAIQDFEDRAGRLRYLLEEEEIMVE